MNLNRLNNSTSTRKTQDSLFSSNVTNTRYNPNTQRNQINSIMAAAAASKISTTSAEKNANKWASIASIFGVVATGASIAVAGFGCYKSYQEGKAIKAKAAANGGSANQFGTKAATGIDSKTTQATSASTQAGGELQSAVKNFQDEKDPTKQATLKSLAESEIGQSQQQIESLTTQIDAANKEADSYDSKIKDTQNEIAEASKELPELDKQIGEMDTQRTNLTKTISENTALTQSLPGEIAALDTQIATLEKVPENETAEAKLERTNKLTELRRQKTEKEKALTKANEDLRQAKADLQTLDGKLTPLKSQRDKILKKIEPLKTKLTEYTGKQTAARNKAQTLTTSKEDLSAKITSARNTLDGKTAPETSVLSPEAQQKLTADVNSQNSDLVNQSLDQHSKQVATDQQFDAGALLATNRQALVDRVAGTGETPAAETAAAANDNKYNSFAMNYKPEDTVTTKDGIFKVISVSGDDIVVESLTDKKGQVISSSDITGGGTDAFKASNIEAPELKLNNSYSSSNFFTSNKTETSTAAAPAITTADVGKTASTTYNGKTFEGEITYVGKMGVEIKNKDGDRILPSINSVTLK